MLRLKRTSSRIVQESGAFAALKQHMRIEGNYADSELSEIAEQAIDHIELMARVSLMTTTWELRRDSLESCMSLPSPPLVSVQSVQYNDADDVQQTWPTTEYDVLETQEPGLIRLAANKTLPSVATDVVIAYTAGYGDEWKDLPPIARRAVLLVGHHYYYHRDGAEMPNGITNVVTQLHSGDEWPGE